MNILYPLDLRTLAPLNPYVGELIETVTNLRRAPVAHGARSLFWDGRWDVVHIQWPEALVGWRAPTRTQRDALRQRLNIIKRHAAIVTTVHNHRPGRFGAAGEPLYDMIYSRTDAFVHLGQASLDAFLREHGNRPWCRRAVHRVIAHGDYSYYRTLPPNDSALAAALNGDSPQLLTVFGAIRSEPEEALAREAFTAANLPNTKLVFAGSVSRQVPAEVLGRWNAEAAPNIARLHYEIPNAQVAPLIAGSRFLFSARKGALNSGVVPLAYTFGVPVIGPDEGDVGELIKAAGGFTYAPGEKDTAAAAIRAAFAMDDDAYEALRQRTTDYAAAHMNWQKIGDQHIALYRELNAPWRRAIRCLNAMRRS